MKILHVINT